MQSYLLRLQLFFFAHGHGKVEVMNFSSVATHLNDNVVSWLDVGSRYGHQIWDDLKVLTTNRCAATCAMLTTLQSRITSYSCLLIYRYQSFSLATFRSERPTHDTAHSTVPFPVLCHGSHCPRSRRRETDWSLSS
jgi:hypothetical protein